MQVTIAFFGDESDTDTFVLGSRELLGLDDAVDSTNVYSPQSPLGAAILGKKKGDSASYEAPERQGDRGHRRRCPAVQALTTLLLHP